MATERDVSSECYDCGEGMPKNSCPGSKRSCGHHCNCIWIHDMCHWCDAVINDEGNLVMGRGE
jgi:hypothetical protein